MRYSVDELQAALGTNGFTLLFRLRDEYILDDEPMVFDKKFYDWAESTFGLKTIFQGNLVIVGFEISDSDLLALVLRFR